MMTLVRTLVGSPSYPVRLPSGSEGLGAFFHGMKMGVSPDILGRLNTTLDTVNTIVNTINTVVNTINTTVSGLPVLSAIWNPGSILLKTWITTFIQEFLGDLS